MKYRNTIHRVFDNGNNKNKISTLSQVSAVLCMYTLLQDQLLPPDNTIMEPTTSSSSWGSLFGILQEGAVQCYLLMGTFHPSHEHTPKWWVLNLSCVGGSGCRGTLREVRLVTLRWVKSGWEQTFYYFFLSLFFAILLYRYTSLIHFFILFRFFLAHH